LEAVPRSWLLVLAAGGEANTSVRELFEHGIDAARLRLTPVMPRDKYLSLAHEVDVALDPFPYVGMTTTCDFLWMGVPTLTLCGNRTAARTGASLYHPVGLSEFVARTPDEYVRRAVTVAQDLDSLAKLRSSLRDRMARSTLVDGRAAAAKLEAAFVEICEARCLSNR